MELSGSFDGTCTGSYPQGYRFWCEWVVNSQSVVNYQSNITVTLKVQRIDGMTGVYALDAINPVELIVGGTVVVRTTVPIDTRNGRVCTLCSYTGTYKHDVSSGSLTLNIAGGFTFTPSGYSLKSGSISGSANINPVDRTAPSVVASISSVDVSTAKLSASSNVPCDIWEYTLNNGAAWSRFSTASVTSVSCNLSGLSAYTDYSIKVRARKTSNQVYGSSASVAFKTLGQSRITAAYPVQIDSEPTVISYDVTVYSSFSHNILLVYGDEILIPEFSIELPVGTTTQQIILTATQRTSILNYMQENKTINASLVLKTYSGNTQIGHASNMTISLNTSYENSAPVFNMYTYQDTNTACVAVTGSDQVIVRNQSILKITVTGATAKNEATIIKYTATVGKTVYESESNVITVGLVDLQGNLSVVVTIEDSRGYTCSVTQVIRVINYETPAITSSQVRRINEVEETIELSFSGKISTVAVDGIAKNTITSAKYRTKQTSSSTWSGWTEITVEQTYGNFSFETLSLTTLDADFSFDIDIQVFDAFESDSEALVIPQGTPLMSFKSKKVGVNVPNPRAAMDISGGIIIDGKTILDIVWPVGTIYTTMSPTSPADLFGGAWTRIANGKMLVGVDDNDADFASAGLTGGEKKHTLTTAELPNHNLNTNYGLVKDSAIGSSGSTDYAFVRGTYSAFPATGSGNVSPSGVGGGQAHNNMPPYLACYIWQRTA